MCIQMSYDVKSENYLSFHVYGKQLSLLNNKKSIRKKIAMKIAVIYE